MTSEYEIRIAGALSGTMADEFAQFTAAVKPEETVIRGTIRDQSELHSVLDRLQQFGLVLIEVKRLPEE